MIKQNPRECAVLSLFIYHGRVTVDALRHELAGFRAIQRFEHSAEARAMVAPITVQGSAYIGDRTLGPLRMSTLTKLGIEEEAEWPQSILASASGSRTRAFVRITT